MNLTLELPATGSCKLDAGLQEDRASLVPDQIYGEQTEINYECRWIQGKLYRQGRPGYK